MSQTERIFHIDREIREKGGASVVEVATRFEVCERQVKRDIEYMRDRLDAPIFWSAARRRYEYSEPWDSLA
ncbi:MAG: WYL domain-containing protein, partial [Spirochaetes bacterium]|nr:WYL domain-containing protein [Spirochaetota bacterium]